MSMFLSNITSSDPVRPSFFEVLSQKEMMATLMPALKWTFSIIAQRHPRLEWASRYPEELFSVLLLIFENHHLRHYDASFSENFYGLKRVNVEMKGKTPSYTSISNKQRYPLNYYICNCMSCASHESKESRCRRRCIK